MRIDTIDEFFDRDISKVRWRWRAEDANVDQKGAIAKVSDKIYGFE